MASHTTDEAIGRRDFARMTLGTFGVAALAGRAAGAVQEVAPGIKLCVQSPANPSDEQLLFLKQLARANASGLPGRSAFLRIRAVQQRLR